MNNPIVKQLLDHETYNYTYLVYDAHTKEGLIIDPVKERFERDLYLIQELGIELKYVLDTHVHADHITSSGIIKESTGAQILVGAATKLKHADILAEDGQEIEIGNFKVTVLATPGHTGGCTSFLIPGMIFSGDVLFIRGCGRTDFQGGSAEALYESVHSKIYTLPDETIIYPGHDYKGSTTSTVAEEKQHNPRLKLSNSKSDFVEIMDNLKLAHPKKIQEALPANQKVGLDDPSSEKFIPKMTMSELYQHYQNLDKTQDLIIDVRSTEEYAEAHVPGSINIPMGKELEHLEMLKKVTNTYLYCRSGRRAQTVYSNLKEKGLKNIQCINSSGMQDWVQAGYPIEP